MTKVFIEIKRKRKRINPDYVEPAIGICEECGSDVVLDDPLNNQCSGCDANYNMSGQRVKAIKDQFNEFGVTDDTGETWSDIYGPGGDDW